MFLCSNVPMIRSTNVLMMISIPSGSTTAADNKASDGPRPGDVTEEEGYVPMLQCSNDTMYQCSMMISIPSGSTTAADNKASDGPRPGDVTEKEGNVPMLQCSYVPMFQ